MLRKLGLLNIANCDYNRDRYKKYIGQTMTWGEFKKIFPNYKPEKLIKPSMRHYSHQFTMGLNEVSEFKPYGICSEGGFYFADSTDIIQFLPHGEYFAIVNIPKDTPVYIEEGKIKIKAFDLDGLESIKTHINASPDPLVYIKQDSKLIRFVDKPSIKVQNEAIKQDPWNIIYISNPDKEVQKKVVSSDGYLIRYIEDPDEEIQLIAIREKEEYIKYIKNPTEKVQMKAINYYGELIQYITNPTVEVQLKVVEINPKYLCLISNPDIKVYRYIIEKYGFLNLILFMF